MSSFDFGPLRQLAHELAFDAHGVAATVTRPGHAAVDTKGVWQDPLLEDQPYGQDYSNREPRRVMALSRDMVSEIERGTLIVAPEKMGDTPKEWQIDGVERVETDYFLVKLTRRTAANV